MPQQSAIVACYWKEVGVTFTECIADFIKDGANSVGPIMTVVHRQRVECVAQDTWQAQDFDAATIKGNCRLLKLGFDPGSQRRVCTGPMVTVIEAQEVEAIARKPAGVAIQPVEFVNIEQQIERAIAQMVTARP